jgi:hypothetical protein
MKEKIESLRREFAENYPWVSIERRAIEQFLRESRNHSVHCLYDFVLSQGLEDEVEI